MVSAPRLVLVLGDQLSEEIAALTEADASRDLVVMAEVAEEATYAPHHPKKIALVFAAMRKFARRLEACGWRVAYTRLDDPDNTGSIADELVRHARAHGSHEVIVTEPGEWRLIKTLEAVPLNVHQVEDRRFFCSRTEFAHWGQGRKVRRMEHFYREMRRKTGLLMDGDSPAGGKWNFDHDNRKPAPSDMPSCSPLRHAPDATTRDVLALVAGRFNDHFGSLEDFWFATDRDGALASLDHFVRYSLPEFGTYQDAMLRENRFLNHAVIALYLNLGLLNPREVCVAAETAYGDGRVPINSAEGFIRQILGWREFIRGTYFLEGPEYTTRNVLEHTRHLPPLYWGAPTHMNCLAHAVEQTRREAYAHHIQRLMVTGNFALLAGIDPAHVHHWYLAVYADAFEWVEAPNTIGMSQFADGGTVGSKPYVSGGAYINRMSDYCGDCAYRVRDRTGPDACPFNLLYWHFLVRHRERLITNPRMKRIYSNWDRMDANHRDTVLSEAEAFLTRLDRQETV